MEARLADRDRVDDFFSCLFWALHPSLGGLKLEKVLLSSSNPSSFLKALIREFKFLLFLSSSLIGSKKDAQASKHRQESNGALTLSRRQGGMASVKSLREAMLWE